MPSPLANFFFLSSEFRFRASEHSYWASEPHARLCQARNFPGGSNRVHASGFANLDDAWKGIYLNEADCSPKKAEPLAVILAQQPQHNSQLKRDNRSKKKSL